MTNRRSTSRVRVRYAETDTMGVAYYANYFVWFEVARTDWLRTSGWSYRDMEHAGFALPVMDAQCTYRQSARYDDELDIETEGHWLSPVRIRFTYVVRRVVGGELLAEGQTMHASLDPQGKPRRLPDRVRDFFRDSVSQL